jgi:hypothetical protein
MEVDREEEKKNVSGNKLGSEKEKKEESEVPKAKPPAEWPKKRTSVLVEVVVYLSLLTSQCLHRENLDAKVCCLNFFSCC